MTKAIATLLLAAATLLGAEGSWTDVVALRPSTRIQLVKRDKKSIQGELVRADAEQVTLTVGGQATTVAKVDVVRISRSAGRNRNALIGAAIGVGASAFVGAFLQRRLNNETGNGDQALAASLAVGGGLGAAIGASQVHFQTIYRAP